jgi:pyrimidine operon attenuation protein/uracil phosphoribosyltransferase
MDSPTLLPDAEQLLDQLTETLRADAGPHMALVGIHTGGVWLAQRLHTALGLSLPLGSLDVSYYRDDHGSRASRSAEGQRREARASSIPFEVEGAHIVLVDDVLYTGRTLRAAMNELFDYGRPARIDLAVLIDRGGRELPIAARYCAHVMTPPLPDDRKLVLVRNGEDEAASLGLRLEEQTHA